MKTITILFACMFFTYTASYADKHALEIRNRSVDLRPGLSQDDVRIEGETREFLRNGIVVLREIRRKFVVALKNEPENNEASVENIFVFIISDNEEIVCEVDPFNIRSFRLNGHAKFSNRRNMEKGKEAMSINVLAYDGRYFESITVTQDGKIEVLDGIAREEAMKNFAQ